MATTGNIAQLPTATAPLNFKTALQKYSSKRLDTHLLHKLCMLLLSLLQLLLVLCLLLLLLLPPVQLGCCSCCCVCNLGCCQCHLMLP